MISSRTASPSASDEATSSAALRRALAPNGETLVGYVGRLAQEKRVELLAPIARQPGVRLVIVGGGPQEEQLRGLLPGAVFLGMRSGNQLARIYASLDVFVHPVALGAWAGCFVTALNLIPVGQLDGGRIAYALFGRRHKDVAIGTFVGLIALAAAAQTPFWLVFAGLVLVLVGFYHVPPLDDLTSLTPERYALGLVCLVLLVLLIPPVPIAINGP